MSREYVVKRKLQEQKGSYFVVLPKIWVESLGLKESDYVSRKATDAEELKEITPHKGPKAHMYIYPPRGVEGVI